MIKTRNKITRTFWVQRGLASIADGLITLLSLGYCDSGLAVAVAEKTLLHGMKKHSEESIW